MSKVIPAEEAQVERWTVPSVEANPANRQGLVTAQKLDEIQKQAHEEGFQAGYKQGLLKGEKDIVAKAARLGQIADRLHKPLDDLDDSIVDEVVTLALVIAKQIIRRELRTDRGQIVAIVRDALNQLPVAARSVRIHLHPEDVQLVKAATAVKEEDQHWTIVEDPGLKHGDCRVVTESSRIDATTEKRLASIVATLLGGERETDIAETPSPAEGDGNASR